MKAELDLSTAVTTESYEVGMPDRELEQADIAPAFIALCQNMHALYPENITSRYGTTSLTLNIESDDGSELIIHIGESLLGQNYVVFANANYYGNIESTYKYRLSDDGRTVIRLSSLDNNDEQHPSGNDQIDEDEIQKIREILLLGKPRYDFS
jgi:hypothetical protein